MILPTNHVLVQSVHKAEEVLSDRSVIDVFVRERESERERREGVRERGGREGWTVPNQCAVRSSTLK